MIDENLRYAPPGFTNLHRQQQIVTDKNTESLRSQGIHRRMKWTYTELHACQQRKNIHAHSTQLFSLDKLPPLEDEMKGRVALCYLIDEHALRDWMMTKHRMAVCRSSGRYPIAILDVDQETAVRKKRQFLSLFTYVVPLQVSSRRICSNFFTPWYHCSALTDL
jgi:hypothetical protein